jgi:CDP-diacylglycerol--serine O-phosphatidyltransferase
MRVRRPPRSRAPRRPTRESFRRGIYLLPSLFTVANLFFGFWAVIDAINGRLDRAPWLILLAGLLDGLDGRIARLTHSTSEFGKEYDSLADVVSFGVAPAILAYQWGLRDMGRWGLATVFLFLVAGSVRLARFNVKAHVADRRFFTGLAIPGGAGALTLMVLLDPEPVVDQRLKVVVCLFVFLVSVLMVSNIPYRSFKTINLRRRWPAWAFFVIAVVVVLIYLFPIRAMALMLGLYIVSGPVGALVRLLRHRPTVTAPPLHPEEIAGAPAAPANPEHP